MAWRKSCTILPKRDGQISCPGSPQKRPAQPTPKDISRLKIFFCSCLPKEERKFMLEEQVYRHTARLKHLQNNQQKFSQVPDSDSNEFGDYLVLMGAIMREEMMIEWLKKSISLLN